MSPRIDTDLLHELEALKAQGLYKTERPIAGPQGPLVRLEDGREVINLCANNYLGLAQHPALLAAAHAALERFGYGLASVRFICGTQTVHRELEKALASFLGTEEAILYSSCFDANGGVFEALLDERDAIISDTLNHASIIDGIRLTKAHRYLFAHKDLDQLEQRLGEARRDGRRRILVVSDGVFSMDGDIAPLPGIVERARAAGAAVMVDDAHASGVLGRGGRGSVSHFRLEGQVEIQVGTLSKAVGVLGGYAAGSQELRDVLIHLGRPFLFSTSHPPAVVAACIAALEVMDAEPELQERLWDNTRYFKHGLEQLGFDCGQSETPITPVIVGEAAKAMGLSDALRRRGVFAQGIAFPTVARDKGRVRTIVTASHTRAQLDRALEAFQDAGRELGLAGSGGES